MYSTNRSGRAKGALKAIDQLATTRDEGRRLALTTKAKCLLRIVEEGVVVSRP
jgi:hypothetical protein